MSSLLIEAVKKKVSLSQELDDMEVNMDMLLQEQVKSKLMNSQLNSVCERDSDMKTLGRKLSRPLLALFGK